MDWFSLHGVAAAVAVLGGVISLGLAVGHARVAGVSLGVGGVLFVGLAFGHFGLTLSPEILEFVREFGLILFVYAIGLQVGPGFFSSLRRDGLTLNLLAAGIVVGGTLVAIAIALLAGVEFPAAMGMLSGAVTNTPSLGAAQQALSGLPDVPPDASQVVGMAYAVAYPFGIIGIIVTMLLLRRVFRIDVKKEAEEFRRAHTRASRPLNTRNVEVTNPNLRGKTVDEIVALTGGSVVATRVFHAGTQMLAGHDVSVDPGDVMHVVGTDEAIDRFRTIVGRYSDIELPKMPSDIFIRRVVVTRPEIADKHLDDLELEDRLGVIVTRIIRSGVEFTPTRRLRLQFGDRVMLVGTDKTTAKAAQELGDLISNLDRPHIIPVFFGIVLGVIVGSIPVAVPSIPAPVRLGLAGGPLVVAILLSRFGRIGPFLSYVPNAAKKLLAEFGIALFLACVGLKSGERFVEVLTGGDGLKWMGLASLITLLPLLTIGFLGRWWKKLDYVSLCGLLSGSMTDPPALAYATDLVGDDSPSVAYATVYPLTMLLRVVLAQVVVLIALG